MIEGVFGSGKLTSNVAAGPLARVRTTGLTDLGDSNLTVWDVVPGGPSSVTASVAAAKEAAIASGRQNPGFWG